MMSLFDGFSVLDILYRTNATTNMKIVVLSAMSQPADQQRALDLGAVDNLVKSQVGVADVMARIRELLGLLAAIAVME